MTAVRDIMTPGVETVTSSQTLQSAARLMQHGDFGSVPVVDDGLLVGILTDRDIVARAVAEGLDTTSIEVGRVATRDPVTTGPDEDLDDALELMAIHRLRRLPVVDDGRLVGIVSQADVALDAKARKTGEMVQEISQPTSVPRE
jgi:CBS domain-containing protein